MSFDLQEAAERKRQERPKAKLQQLWSSKDYSSSRVSLSDNEDEETDETVPIDTEGIY